MTAPTPLPPIPPRTYLVLTLLLLWVLALGWVFSPWFTPPPYDAALRVTQPDLGLKPTPAGIVNLQLALTQSRAKSVLEAWKGRTDLACAQAGRGGAAPLTDCARLSVERDSMTIAAYACLGTLIFWLLPWGLAVMRSRFWWLLALAPLAAGSADLGENLGLVAMLDSASFQPWTAALIGALALLKLALLGLTLLAALLVLGFFAFYRATRRGACPAEPPPYLADRARVLENEAIYLKGRRHRAGLSEIEGPPVGLTLSGGGIRSATLSLGVIQVLSRCGLGAHIDYLSTVSGGGYIGAALSSLLSCREGCGHEPPPWRFGPADRPHFDLARPAQAPFEDAPPATSTAGARAPLDGRMVVRHLRAFGDYLVRRRLTDRDVLRALGTVLSGVLTSLVLYGAVLIVLAALLQAAIALTGGMGLDLQGGPRDVLRQLVQGAGGPQGLALAAGLGAAFAFGATLLAGFCADLTPEIWFRRDGDTPEDARQRRALWLLAGLGGVAALLVVPILSTQVDGLKHGILLPAVFLAGAAAGAIAMYLLLAARMAEAFMPFEVNTRSYQGAVIALFLYLLLLALGLVAAALVLGLLTQDKNMSVPGVGAQGGGLVAIGALASGLTAWWRARSGQAKAAVAKVRGWYAKSAEAIQRLILALGVAAVLVAGLALALVLVDWGLRALYPADLQVVGHALLLAAAVYGLVWLATRALNFNRLSLHYFYRDRLIEAYLTTQSGPTDGARGTPEVRRDQGSLRLGDLHGRIEPLPSPAAVPAARAFDQYRLEPRGITPSFTRPKLVQEPFPGVATSAPYHLVCTCLNLATDRDAAYRTRKSDIFLFSRLYCGSRATGFVDTEVYRAGETKLARAMTISGAAADSAIGRETFFAQSFACALFNIRLGQWLENPAYRCGTEVWRQERGVFWPWYLGMEALGMSDRRHRLVHLSDGGHTGDNLGLIPLLERRCRLVLAVDGEQDPDLGFRSLMHALQYVQSDLGIQVDLPLKDLCPDDKGLVASHYALGTIRYPQTPTLQASMGVLAVLKSSVTAKDDDTVRKYRDSHQLFPHETTLDQFFAEDQFEAYRRLGQAMAAQLVAEHPELAQGRLELPPPPHPVSQRWRPPRLPIP